MIRAITVGVFRQIILMVVFSWVKGIQRFDFSGDLVVAFSGESLLNAQGDRLYTVPQSAVRAIGRAGEGSFGRLAGGSLELSNVDLTQEFADMIIIQRGYQASSRVLTVTNEMIDTLYNSTRGG